jgi:DinB family protein
MLRRTKGCILITLLVITGLAGTFNNTSLSKKERKFVADHMKDTKNAVMKSVSGLSESQLNFKQSTDRWSVKECIYHITLSEKNLWLMLEGALKSPVNSEKRSEIKMTDDQIIKIIEDRSNKVKTNEMLEPVNAQYKNVSEALSEFKNMRNDHIKYLKNTTEDLRNHVVKMPFGYIDAYELCLMISAHNNRHLQQINEIKADPKFPKK